MAVVKRRVKHVKRIFLIVLVLCFAFTLVACAGASEVFIETREPVVVSEVQHLFFPARNFEDLARRSADVVRVEVLDERVEWLMLWDNIPSELDPADFYNVYTLRRVKILEVFQGISQVGDIIDVFQEGGEVDGELWLNRNLIPMSSGEELLLFLHRPDDKSLAYPMNPWEGAFRFVDGVWQQVFPHASPDDRFAVTPEELEALAEYNGDSTA